MIILFDTFSFVWLNKRLSKSVLLNKSVSHCSLRVVLNGHSIYMFKNSIHMYIWK